MIGERIEGRTGAAAGSCLGCDPRMHSVSHSMDSKVEGGFQVGLLFGLRFPCRVYSPRIST